eukprot:916609-Rhodomonas_salina.1
MRHVSPGHHDRKVRVQAGSLRKAFRKVWEPTKPCASKAWMTAMQRMSARFLGLLSFAHSSIVLCVPARSTRCNVTCQAPRPREAAAHVSSR